ncbi:MAG: RNA polymerase sigma-70 factor [Bacteroidota bacterium]
MKRQKDHQLLQAISQYDDHQAFDELYHKYYESLCLFSHSIIHSRELAEEVVSDVFVKLWKNRKRYLVRTSPKSYLFSATRNQTIDYLRKHQREQNISYSLPTFYETHTLPTSSPEDDFIFQEVAQRVNCAIQQLPPKGKHIFLMSREQGLKYKEIAEKLNISIKTVETHMRRALIHLRREVLPYT